MNDIAAVERPGERRSVVGVSFALAGGIGALWAWRVLRTTYFFQDEWAMIRRGVILGPIESSTKTFNGHIWLFQDTFYRVQALGFGLDSNRFIVVAFLGALVTLHLTLAALARQLGMPLVPALLFGALLTYLGPAAQNYVFAVQISPTLATGAAIAAATVVLGSRRSARSLTLVATLLLVSVLLDSVIGFLALSLGGGLVLQLWPRRHWWVLAPAGLVTAFWLAFLDLGPTIPSPIGERLTFALELAARSAGALVGSGPWVGVVVLTGVLAVTVAHVRAGEMKGSDRAVTIAGAVATTIFIGAIAQSRAGVEIFSFYQNNRYCQNVAIPLSVTVLPSGIGLARRMSSGNVGAAALSVAFVVAFLFGQNDARGYEKEFVDRNDLVRNSVIDTLSLISTNCPSGQPPLPDVDIVGLLSPGLRVELIAELARRGLLSPDQAPRVPDETLLARLCPP